MIFEPSEKQYADAIGSKKRVKIAGLREPQAGDFSGIIDCEGGQQGDS